MNHRQIRIDARELKRLKQISDNLLQLSQDDPTLCCCDMGDSKVGIQPVTCDIHDLAGMVDDMVRRQLNKATQIIIAENLNDRAQSHPKPRRW